MTKFDEFEDKKFERRDRFDDWRAAVNEVDPPQPAPGKKVISFGLPLEENVPVKPVRRSRKAAAEPEEPQPVDFTAYNVQDYGTLSEAPRRRAREVAMMLLFAACGGCDWNTVSNILNDAGIKGDNVDFAVQLAQQAHAEAAESDALLSAYAHDWSVDRFPAVDLSIMRMAVTEMRHDSGDDHSIIINEAIELGKKFGSEESGAFINGILDAIYNNEFKDRSAVHSTDAAAAAEEAPAAETEV